MVNGHREDQVGLPDCARSDLAAAMMLERPAHRAEDVNRMVRSRIAGGRRYSSRSYDESVPLELVDGATQPARQQQLADRFGHRAAARIARADEQDDQA